MTGNTKAGASPSVIQGEPDPACEVWRLPAVEGPLCPRLGQDDVPPRVTASNLEALQHQAFEEAFEQGMQRGLQEGRRSGQERLDAEAQRLSALVACMAQPAETLDDEVQQCLVDLALLVARHLVRREIKTSRGEVVGVVREALAQLPINVRHPRIHLNPEDVELVRSALSLDEDDQTYKLVTDPLVSTGGCVVETESSLIDATLEARLNALVAKMFGGERATDHDD